MMLEIPVQLRPFPTYPALHVQVNDPAVFRQTALASQLWAFVEHSFMSINKTAKKTTYTFHFSNK